MIKKYIRGNKERSKEVIAELELTEIAIIENQYNTLTEYNKTVMLKRLQQ